MSVAFTRTSIPVDEEHIPTREIAKNWEHLRTIQSFSSVPSKDEMHDLFDCIVGLLIGYDISQALTQAKFLLVAITNPTALILILDGVSLVEVM